MCGCGCDIDVECEGKKASVHCNRPRWEDVYKRYIESEKHLRRDVAFLHGRSQQLLTSNAALVFYALKSVMNIDLFSFIADEKELKDWLYKNKVWGKADVEISVSGEKDLVMVRRKIKWMSGIYIILGNAKNPHAHATLWDGSLKNAINGDNHIDKGGTVYFWELMTCNPTSNNPNVFSQEEFDRYIKYIEINASKTGRYGEGRNDKHNCINTVIWGMKSLLGDGVPAKSRMDPLMVAMKTAGYADGEDAFDFKDINGKKTTGDPTYPYDFWDKSLSEVIIQNLGSDAGYYFFGLSIMHGYHSAMVVVNKMESGKSDGLKFNIYDQHKSFIAWVESDYNNKGLQWSYDKDWYSREKMDTMLLQYVRYTKGHPILDENRKRINNGITTTRVTPIKHKLGELK